MKINEGKQIVENLHSLDIFPQEIQSKIDHGIVEYLEEVNIRTLKNIKLDKLIGKLETAANKDNYTLTKKDIITYLEELNPRFS